MEVPRSTHRRRAVAGRRQSRHGRAARRALRRPDQHPADPPGRRRAARRRPPGHAQHQDAAARSAAVAASRTGRRAPAAPVRARPARRSSPAVASCTARHPRDYAQRTPEEDEGRRPASAPCPTGPATTACTSSTSLVDGDTPVDQGGVGDARPDRVEPSTCSWCSSATTSSTWKSLRNVDDGARARPGPAQHLRRARQRRRRLHRRRALDAFVAGPAKRQSRREAGQRAAASRAPRAARAGAEVDRGRKKRRSSRR